MISFREAQATRSERARMGQRLLHGNQTADMYALADVLQSAAHIGVRGGEDTADTSEGGTRGSSHTASTSTEQREIRAFAASSALMRGHSSSATCAATERDETRDIADSNRRTRTPKPDRAWRHSEQNARLRLHLHQCSHGARDQAIASKRIRDHEEARDRPALLHVVGHSKALLGRLTLVGSVRGTIPLRACGQLPLNDKQAI